MKLDELKRAEMLDYLRARIEVEGDCWLWTNAMSRGYPVMNSRRLGGHQSPRVAMWLAMGKRIREGYKLATPECDCRCINPAHTRELTHKKIFQLASKRGRLASGATQRAATLKINRKKPHVKLNPEIVRAMRARYAETNNAALVSREFGVAHAHAHRVVTGKLWNETNPFSI